MACRVQQDVPAALMVKHGVHTAAVAALDQELGAWRAKCAAALEAAERRGGQPAGALPEDVASLFEAAAEIIQKNELSRGEPIWLPEGDFRPGAGRRATEAPSDWPSYAAARGMPMEDEAETAIITNVLTFPLTIYHALQTAIANGALSRDVIVASELTVHILGAEYDTEVEGAEKWAELLQLLPGVQHLRLLLVGPELPKDVHGQRMSVSLDGAEGEAMTKQKKKKKRTAPPRVATIEFHRSLYHDLPKGTEKPHLAVAFNSGLADLRGDWGPTITRLCADDVLCCFTSYHLQEAEYDTRTLSAVFAANVLCGPSTNPFRSGFPNPDPIFGDRAYYVNSFFTLFRGTAAPQRPSKPAKAKPKRVVVRKVVKRKATDVGGQQAKRVKTGSVKKTA
eukprot:TRINITY_DN9416_c0_g1_i2.p1 TRINITY_DN9416_c0_g1~~TRINITY_DN9416_c0_g1_i2.p1  ORF type:complete len:395 (+),score=92.90 TRINITY_DN9416_c0_g1_i2:56-1240(+)